MGPDDHDPAPSPDVLLRRAEPSWGRVLADTVKLAVVRRVGAAGSRRPRASGSRPGLVSRGWRFAAVALTVTGAAVLVTLGLTGAHSRVAAGNGVLSPVAGSRARAAAWIAGQVSDDAIIACDPGWCALLQEQGVAAGRLMPLRATAASPSGASVLVTSLAAGSKLARHDAAALIASFGSGDDRVAVFAAETGGASVYRSALRADLAARRSAGSQLLQNSRIRFSGPSAARLRAGEVDTRLLATLAVLASRYSFRVTGLGDAAPGAPVLFREVAITGMGRGRAGALAMVRAQDPPYGPAHALVDGQAGLSIEFALPSPLGLLSPVLDVGSPPPSSVSGTFR